MKLPERLTGFYILRATDDLETAKQRKKQGFAVDELREIIHADLMAMLQDERMKILHRNGGFDWIPGALERNAFRADLRQKISEYTGVGE